METSDKISEFIASQILHNNENRPGLDDPLLEGGILDSAGIFSLVTFLEEEFGISVDDDEIVVENFDSVSSITRMVTDKQA